MQPALSEVEMPSGTVTKYYYFASQRVAMRRGTEPVIYVYGDHLGSTSVTRSDSGVLARQWYYPYGGVRLTEGTLPTDYTFTGQKRDSYINLIHMSARWYDPRH